MRRRAFLATLIAATARPGRAAAQPATKMPRVGYLFSFTPASGRHYWEACRHGLRELGYVEERTIRLEPRWANERHEALPALVADLLRAQVDVIVTAATPASQAARAATPGNFSHTIFLEATRTAAQATGSTVHAVEARTREELEPALAAAHARADALIVFDDPVLWSHRARLVDLAARRRLPVMYGYREFVDEGGLMSYGPSRPDLYRRTATYVDKILRGARPAELPVERPTRFELVVNLRAAAAIGVTMPPALLARADAIIQ
jgi:putative tryptophan/tyrosine transport system substrate-binding protein